MSPQRSVLSFTDRGPWGDARFPGNCSGHVVRTLLEHFAPRLFVDPMEGSGTSRAVATQMGIAYVGLDLRSGYDLVQDPLRPRLPCPADLVFVHPPYWNIVRYSGVVWGGSPHPADLSHIADYDAYLNLLHRALRNAAQALAAGGHLVVLLGDIRRQSRYYSPQASVALWPELGVLRGIWIKLQHHVRSAAKAYPGNLVRIEHEYLTLFQASRSTSVLPTLPTTAPK